MKSIRKDITMNRAISFFIILILVSSTSCGQSREEKEKAEAERLKQEKIKTELASIESVNRKVSSIFSSIEVGLSLIEYTSLLRDLKSEIDYIKSQLSVSEVKSKLREYENVYNTLIDAHSLWNDEIDLSSMHDGYKAFRLKTVSYKGNKDDAETRESLIGILSDLINRYDLHIIEDEEYIKNTGYTIINYYLYSRSALSKIWQEAAIQYSEISASQTT